jgi:hypothetical protein
LFNKFPRWFGEDAPQQRRNVRFVPILLQKAVEGFLGQ